MLVKAAPGLQCPKEENPREYINDSEPVDVPDTAYYQRLVDDGSLVDGGKQESEVRSQKRGEKQ